MTEDEIYEELRKVYTSTEQQLEKSVAVLKQNNVEDIDDEIQGLYENISDIFRRY
jgi:hypothetical protein